MKVDSGSVNRLFVSSVEGALLPDTFLSFLNKDGHCSLSRSTGGSSAGQMGFQSDNPSSVEWGNDTACALLTHSLTNSFIYSLLH